VADWFVVVESHSGLDGSSEVFECISYRSALALAHKLAEDGNLSVEVSDYEGCIIRAIGLDEWDGTQGRTTVPLRAGLYRWQNASETYRLIMP